MHGGGGYGRLFAPVGLLLRKAGYEVLAPDLPGYGLSKNDSSNNPELSQLVAEDPCGGGVWVPVNFMQSIFSVKPAIEPESFDICPVLLAHPAADRWTSIESSLPFFDRIKGDKTLVLLEHCGHIPVEEPGISQLEHAAIAFLTKIADKSGALQKTAIRK